MSEKEEVTATLDAASIDTVIVSTCVCAETDKEQAPQCMINLLPGKQTKDDAQKALADCAEKVCGKRIHFRNTRTRHLTAEEMQKMEDEGKQIPCDVLECDRTQCQQSSSSTPTTATSSPQPTR
jgi:hypothetical protein